MGGNGCALELLIEMGDRSFGQETDSGCSNKSLWML